MFIAQIQSKCELGQNLDQFQLHIYALAMMTIKIQPIASPGKGPVVMCPLLSSRRQASSLRLLKCSSSQCTPLNSIPHFYPLLTQPNSSPLTTQTTHPHPHSILPPTSTHHPQHSPTPIQLPRFQHPLPPTPLKLPLLPHVHQQRYFIHHHSTVF